MYTLVYIHVHIVTLYQLCAFENLHRDVVPWFGASTLNPKP